MNMSNQAQVIELIRRLTGQANVLTIPRLLIDLTGSIESALFLNQCIYWSDRTTRKDGYFYKTYAEWQAETGLSRRDLDSARKRCAAWIDTKRTNANGAPTVHYYVDFDALIRDLLPICTDRANRFDQSVQIDLTETYKSITETTTEINNINKRERANARPARASRSDPRTSHPAIQAVRTVTGKYPPKAAYNRVIERLGEDPDIDKLQEVYTTWSLRGNNPHNLEGIFDWYESGVPEKRNVKVPPAAAEPVRYWADGTPVME
jgi:hypothetical protein